MTTQPKSGGDNASLKFLFRYVFYFICYLVLAAIMVTQLPSHRNILSTQELTVLSSNQTESPPHSSVYQGVWLGAWGGEAAAFFDKNIDMKLIVTEGNDNKHQISMTLLENIHYGIPFAHIDYEVPINKNEPLSWSAGNQKYSFQFDETTKVLRGQHSQGNSVNHIELYRAGEIPHRKRNSLSTGLGRLGFYNDDFSDALLFALWFEVLIEGLLYLIVAVPSFWFLNKAVKSFISKRQIQAPPRPQQWVHELGYSLVSVLMFSLVGTYLTYLAYTGVLSFYPNIADRGIFYWLFSIVIGLILHDAYFYWAHRLMHHRIFYKMLHHAHHLSKAPTTLASYSFGPIEAIVQATFIPLVAWIVPMHFSVVVILFIANLIRSAIGHSGFEVFPRNTLTSPWLKWNATVTHHDMHHQYGQGNYALYFSWWDKWMGTEHPNYAESFYAVRDKIEEQKN